MSRRRFVKLVGSYLAGAVLSCLPVSVRATNNHALLTNLKLHKTPATIAFGSCNHIHLPQPMWAHIRSHDPDLFLWLGDVVYADTDDPVEMARHYRVQASHPEYQKVSKSLPVLGLWDDHDYGGNNLGIDNPIKEQGQQLFLDFLGEPAESMRRKQQGIYTTYTYGSGDQQVKLYLLDTRYHRERGGRGRATLLGVGQWRWLEVELQQSTATVNIIASGSSVLSSQIPGGEEWEDFRWDKKQLFHLLNKHNVQGVLFLTGDRHFAAHLTERVAGKTYHEFMCSGLTHYLTRPKAKFLMELFLGKSNCFFGTNFGLLKFGWSDRNSGEMATAGFEVYNKYNQKQMYKELQLVDKEWVLSLN